MTKNLFIGRTVIRLERVDSSNNYARTLLRDKMPLEGTVIVADEQTAGRGQRANLWVSEAKKNLTCSYILRPAFLAAKDQFMQSAAVALAVEATVSEFLPTENVRIKWPNDILVNGRKTSGILIENSLRGMNLETSIVGIGMNVNQTEFADGLNATSLKLITRENVDVDEVLERLNENLEQRYLKLRQGKHQLLLDALNNRLFGFGESMNLNINDQAQQVTIVGVRQTGELELEHHDGSRALHQHHEVTWNLKA